MNKKNTVDVVTDSQDLRDFCNRHSQARYITVDTEFIREKTYWPKVCLIQIAGPGDTICIDPLADELELGPLFDLLQNEKVLKVFHAARQDMEIFFHISGALPKPVFDTQIAAMVCGYGDSVGYETLVAGLTGARIDKSSRFTDWSLRPLSAKQLSYAMSDVTHLRPVYEKLSAKLDATGRTSWLDAEMDVLTAEKTYDIDPRAAYKRLKLKTKKARVMAIAREVAAWRELEAKTRNLPRPRILKDDQVVEIAHHAPTTVGDLARTRGLGRKLAEGKQGLGILNAVQTALAMAEADCPPPPEKPDGPDGAGPAADLLKLLLKMVCREERVAQKLVASSAEIALLSALGEKANIPALNGWRRALYGETALQLMRGEIGFAIRDGKIVRFPTDVQSH